MDRIFWVHGSWDQTSRVHASSRPESSRQGSKRPESKRPVVQNPCVQASRVQSSRVQAKRPDHASRVQLFWYVPVAASVYLPIMKNLNSIDLAIKTKP